MDTLTWDRPDLIKALNNRLSVFARGRIKDFQSILLEKDSNSLQDNIFELSNGNPRDLWHVMDSIFRKQFQMNDSATVLTPQAIEEGLKDFVSRFNYFEYYPRRSDARANSMDVYAYIRHLLRLSAPEFSRNQLTERSGVSGGSANNYVTAMENMGLISSYGQTGGNVNYVIRDPKIKYALINRIPIHNQ
jgi:hypothetical protein